MWFAPGEGNFVLEGSGALEARAQLQRYPERWGVDLVVVAAVGDAAAAATAIFDIIIIIIIIIIITT